MNMPERDTDLTGCPSHWQVVPDLPPKGYRAPTQGPDGYGTLYKVKLRGLWFLIKFLRPPLHRLSITSQYGEVRIFENLDDLASRFDAIRWVTGGSKR